jgi:hypothetical protein
VRIWKFPDQVVRLAVLLIAALVVLILLRQQFVPETFGELGHYRAAAVEIVAAQPIRYAGLQACAECHTDEADMKASSYHRGLTCEGCHGPASAHAEDPTETHPVVPKEREGCLHCHDYLPSRPTGFPQIIETFHNPMEPCTGCHDAHDPTPPETPGSCSACHAEIARTKSVSHHRTIDCDTCHEATEEHRISPRSHLPTKPVQRDFCGQCHAVAADSSPEIPRVELGEHGGRYLCWQCHYPHFPEGQ